MTLRAGFSEIDITPPVGTGKIGWIADLKCDKILDPLFARVAVFDNGREQVGFVQLDTLSVRWTTTDQLRRRLAEAYGFNGANVMVSATHNHAGPAICACWPVPRDETYVASVIDRCVQAFGKALDSLAEVQVGFARVQEFDVAFNRRVVMRDGLVRSQTHFGSNPDALYLEGPTDPDVSVLALRAADGALVGALVNFACHPTHHGGTDEVTAGFPGLVCKTLKECGIPITLYLNGFYGNLITSDFQRGTSLDMETTAQKLVIDIQDALADMIYGDNDRLNGESGTVELPYRVITDDEYHGRVPGAQRFRADEVYEGFIDTLVQKIAREGTQKAEVQALRVGDTVFVGFSGEVFCELGIQVKTAAHPQTIVPVGGANGMVGYVPTRGAFSRGGYETTLGSPCRLAPGSGEMLVEEAARLLAKI
ncbi:MAG: neutral/alkaline non-lysosomal ceramidase N-terminal domain-containing protein [Lentisphaeria bacterium]|nr:neutral/alkaline non-lysosomal ceramidase N-terminal domain-containing protein [Lentisphaeria bacterium]